MATDATGQSVTRTADTEAAYLVHEWRLITDAFTADPDAPDGFEAAVHYFAEQHGRWEPATIRQYGAALKWGIKRRVAAGVYDQRQADALLRTLMSGPMARTCGAPRTSARKRRDITDGELERLVTRLKTGGLDGNLCAGILFFGVMLGLRPSEREDIEIGPDVATIRNRKTTNGRALGPTRTLSLQGMGAKAIARLGELSQRIRSAVAAAESPRHFWDCMAARLAHACRAEGIARVALYTLRHRAMSDAKGVMSAAEVAAFAGHATTATATTNYARRRPGRRSRLAGRVRPTPADVARVDRPPASGPGRMLVHARAHR